MMVDPGTRSGRLSLLEGVWHGSGSGDYPTMEPFDFDEEIRFARLDDRTTRYEQAATSSGAGELLHSEGGIWRLTPDCGLEVAIAFPGVTEVSEGTLVEGRVELASTMIGRATTGARLVSVRRVYVVDGDTLSYDIHMAARDIPLTRHIWASLRRVG